MDSDDQQDAPDRSLRRWFPHRTPKAQQWFAGRVLQIVGGKRWSLCLITDVDGVDALVADGWTPPRRRALPADASQAK